MAKSKSLSKQKGAQWERRVCHSLSLWISKGLRDDLFWRSAMSGGRATVRSRKGPANRMAAQAGDITGTDSLAMPFADLFYVECKFYQDLRLSLAVYGLDGEMPRIWDEPYIEARKYGKIPLTVAKQNRQKPLGLTTMRGIKLLFGMGWGKSCLAHINRRVGKRETEIFLFKWESLISRVSWPDVERRAHETGLLNPKLKRQ